MAFLQRVDHTKTTKFPLNTEGQTIFAEQNGTLMLAEKESCQVSFLKTSRGWVILDYTGQQTFVNGLRVADFKRIREGDVIQIGKIVVMLTEIVSTVVTQESDLLKSQTLCPIDGVGFAIGENVVFCPACGAPHHADCWEFNKESCAAGAHCDYRKP